MHRFPLSTLRFLTAAVMVAFLTVVMDAAPETDAQPAKEVPRVVMKNLRMERQIAGEDAIELPRKKFVPIDADLETGTWGFSRTPCFQYTYVPQNGPPNTFPEQILTHPVVESDPCLAFEAIVYRGEKLTDENIAGRTYGLFGNEMSPWEGKLRYWLDTPDQPGEYTLEFSVYDQERAMKGNAEIVKLARQKLVIR